MNAANEPALESWVPVHRDSHFPMQNLPYCVFGGRDGGDTIGVRIGDFVLDLAELEDAGVFESCIHLAHGVFGQPRLNGLMALGKDAWREARGTISGLLEAGNPRLRDNDLLRDHVLAPVGDVELRMPVDIGDYTDFYSSREHAKNVGAMFRGAENALLPNWLHLPVAYHGRASSVVVSGTPIHRPSGQVKEDDAVAPVFRPTNRLDFELEMGFFIGPGSDLGRPIAVADADEHIFGMVLVNDWSARDIQRWEYQPLGPFDAKNFATSISPWVVTMDALAPFRCAAPRQDPEPLPYLRGGAGTYDIRLEVRLESDGAGGAVTICESNYRHLYWTMSQQLAHHTVTGCNLRPGDLMASGTISAPGEKGHGSLLELTWNGERPIQLPGGRTRTFLEDGDIVTMTAWCQGDGYRVGFGEVTGRVLPAR